MSAFVGVIVLTKRQPKPRFFELTEGEAESIAGLVAKANSVREEARARRRRMKVVPAPTTTRRRSGG